MDFLLKLFMWIWSRHKDSKRFINAVMLVSKELSFSFILYDVPVMGHMPAPSEQRDILREVSFTPLSSTVRAIVGTSRQ